MKLIIFVVLFIFFIIYYNNNSKCLNEMFRNIKEKFLQEIRNNPEDRVSLYSPYDINNVGPFYINGNMKGPEPIDVNEFSLYDDKYWMVKPHDFSDIFNNESTNICSAINVDPYFSNMIFGCDPSVKPDNIFDPTKLVKNNIIIEKPKDTLKPTPQVTTKPRKQSKFPETIADSITYYNLVGYAINEYYNQYYLLYETKINDPINNEASNNPKFLNEKLYKYVLVRMRKDVPHIIHKVGPRDKIKLGDFVYLSYGVFQLGPFRISEIK
jgi:hypothetical protein